jgi:hypothetical protein
MVTERERAETLTIFMSDLPGFHSLLGGSLMIEFDEGWSMNLIGVFPCVVAFGVSFPFDQILQGLAPPPGPMGMYLLHLVLFFPLNQIRRWSGKVWSM